MAIGSSIQFRGKQAVLEAFDNVDVQAFTIWQGKQYLFKGSGATELDGFLTMLEQNSMNAIYTVKVYEDITDKKQIKSNTPDDGSFNFKLNADGMEITNGQYTSFNNRNELISRIGAIENKFDAIISKLEEQQEDEPENRLGIIGEIIGHPAIAPLLPQVMAMLMGTNAQQQQYRQLATVGNVPDPKLNEAIERLKLADDRLSDHLMKLADIAANDPNTFAMIMQSLDNYQLK